MGLRCFSYPGFRAPVRKTGENYGRTVLCVRYPAWSYHPTGPLCRKGLAWLLMAFPGILASCARVCAHTRASYPAHALSESTDPRTFPIDFHGGIVHSPNHRSGGEKAVATMTWFREIDTTRKFPLDFPSGRS